MARGSARSIAGVNITAALAEHADMLAGFGGHPMAAGLSLSPAEDHNEQINRLRRCLSQSVQRMQTDTQLLACLYIDGVLALSDLSLELAMELERLAPFGPGNPALTLVSKSLKISNHTYLGREEEHLQITVEDEQSVSQRVIWWQGQGWSLPQGRFDLAYHIRAVNFSGKRDIQVEWVEARTEEIPPQLIELPKKAIQVLDYRQEVSPILRLKQIKEQAEVQVWCEAEAKEEVDGFDRYNLRPADNLLIWTSPPNPAVLQAVLERVSPKRVYLFGKDAGMDHPQAFMERLAGLIKYMCKAYQGKLVISRLAAATAQSEIAVRLGIEWLQAKGFIWIEKIEGDEIWVKEGGDPKPKHQAEIVKQIKDILDESAAYRAYFARADKDALISML